MKVGQNELERSSANEATLYTLTHKQGHIRRSVQFYTRCDQIFCRDILYIQSLNQKSAELLWRRRLILACVDYLNCVDNVNLLVSLLDSILKIDHVDSDKVTTYCPSWSTTQTCALSLAQSRRRARTPLNRPSQPTIIGTHVVIYASVEQTGTRLFHSLSKLKSDELFKVETNYFRQIPLQATRDTLHIGVQSILIGSFVLHVRGHSHMFWNYLTGILIRSIVSVD